MPASGSFDPKGAKRVITQTLRRFGIEPFVAGVRLIADRAKRRWRGAGEPEDRLCEIVEQAAKEYAAEAQIGLEAYEIDLVDLTAWGPMPAPPRWVRKVALALFEHDVAVFGPVPNPDFPAIAERLIQEAIDRASFKVSVEGWFRSPAGTSEIRRRLGSADLEVTRDDIIRAAHHAADEVPFEGFDLETFTTRVLKRFSVGTVQIARLAELAVTPKGRMIMGKVAHRAKLPKDKHEDLPGAVVVSAHDWRIKIGGAFSPWNAEAILTSATRYVVRGLSRAPREIPFAPDEANERVLRAFGSCHASAEEAALAALRHAEFFGVLRRAVQDEVIRGTLRANSAAILLRVIVEFEARRHKGFHPGGMDDLDEAFYAAMEDESGPLERNEKGHYTGAVRQRKRYLLNKLRGFFGP